MIQTYEDALTEARAEGMANCSDAAVMASFCEGVLQLVAGAVSPKLVWEGAQKRGMTALELSNLAARDPRAVAELMWL